MKKISNYKNEEELVEDLKKGIKVCFETAIEGRKLNYTMRYLKDKYNMSIATRPEKGNIIIWSLHHYQEPNENEYKK